MKFDPKADSCTTGSSHFCGNDASKPDLNKIEIFRKQVDEVTRMILGDPVLKPLRKQRRLTD